jgi:hypothetical protein
MVRADVRYQDQQIPAGEEWYYEIDGRAHGPLSWKDLENLLDCSGETAAEARIRKGAEGDWLPFRRSWATDMPRPRISASELSGPSPRSVSPARQGGFRDLIRTHRDIVAVAGGWILLNVLFLLFWPEPYARERSYLFTLRAIVAEVDQLRAIGASDQEWGELARSTRERMAPIVRDLRKSANSSELPRQQLLWSARDLVPRIMGPPNKERDKQERRLKQYLESVEQVVGR